MGTEVAVIAAADLKEVPKAEALPADIKPEVRELVVTYSSLQAITTPATRKVASDMLEKARRMWQDAEEERKTETADLKETIRIISEPFNFVIKVGKLIDEECGRQLSAYDRKIEQERRAQQAQLNRQIQEQNKQVIADAEEKGEIPALMAPAIVAAIPKTIVTSSGTTQTKAKGKKDFTINGLTSEEVDGMSAADPRLALIPREYLEPSIKRLKAAADNDIPVCDGFVAVETFNYRLPAKKK